MKIKVCGMRNSENIKELVNLSPDYIGFIFYEKSKRFVTDFPEVEIPKSIKKVGVFVNETIKEILKKVVKYNLQAVQLHGDETPEYCKDLKYHLERCRELEIIKAFAIDKDFNFAKIAAYQEHCDLFLFDTKGNDYGGNGIKYDWNILQQYKGERSFLLSGGINDGDVESIKQLKHEKFIGIDVNSAFEETPAVKKIEKLSVFMSLLRK